MDRTGTGSSTTGSETPGRNEDEQFTPEPTPEHYDDTAEHDADEMTSDRENEAQEVSDETAKNATAQVSDEMTSDGENGAQGEVLHESAESASGQASDEGTCDGRTQPRLTQGRGQAEDTMSEQGMTPGEETTQNRTETTPDQPTASHDEADQHENEIATEERTTLNVGAETWLCRIVGSQMFGRVVRGERWESLPEHAVAEIMLNQTNGVARDRETKDQGHPTVTSTSAQESDQQHADGREGQTGARRRRGQRGFIMSTGEGFLQYYGYWRPSPPHEHWESDADSGVTSDNGQDRDDQDIDMTSENEQNSDMTSENGHEGDAASGNGGHSSVTSEHGSVSDVRLENFQGSGTDISAADGPSDENRSSPSEPVQDKDVARGWDGHSGQSETRPASDSSMQPGGEGTAPTSQNSMDHVSNWNEDGGSFVRESRLLLRTGEEIVTEVVYISPANWEIHMPQSPDFNLSSLFTEDRQIENGRGEDNEESATSLPTSENEGETVDCPQDPEATSVDSPEDGIMESVYSPEYGVMESVYSPEDGALESVHPPEDSVMESVHPLEDGVMESVHPLEDGVMESVHPLEDGVMESVHQPVDGALESVHPPEDEITESGSRSRSPRTRGPLPVANQRLLLTTNSWVESIITIRTAPGGGVLVETVERNARGDANSLARLLGHIGSYVRHLRPLMPTRRTGVPERRLQRFPVMPLWRLRPADVTVMTCSICMEAYTDEDSVRRLPCGHFFHQDCIDQWLGNANTCPNCRKVLYVPTTASRNWRVNPNRRVQMMPRRRRDSPLSSSSSSSPDDSHPHPHPAPSHALPPPPGSDQGSSAANLPGPSQPHPHAPHAEDAQETGAVGGRGRPGCTCAMCSIGGGSSGLSAIPSTSTHHADDGADTQLQFHMSLDSDDSSLPQQPRSSQAAASPHSLSQLSDSGPPFRPIPERWAMIKFSARGQLNLIPCSPPTSPSTQPPSTQPLPTQSLSTQPLPTQPLSTQPLPTQPLSTQPLPTQPLSTQPLPTQPLSTQTLSTQALSTQPLSTQPLSTQSLSTDPLSTDPLSTQPLSTQHSVTLSSPHQPFVTSSPSTQSSMTQSPSTQSSMTHSPPTQPSMIHFPSTQHSMIHSPSTQPSMTHSPSTQPPMTHYPPTQPTMTHSASTHPSMTHSPSTQHSMTHSPSIQTSLTHSPSTLPFLTLFPPTHPSTIHSPPPTHPPALYPYSPSPPTRPTLPFLFPSPRTRPSQGRRRGGRHRSWASSSSDDLDPPSRRPRLYSRSHSPEAGVGPGHSVPAGLALDLSSEGLSDEAANDVLTRMPSAESNVATGDATNGAATGDGNDGSVDKPSDAAGVASSATNEITSDARNDTPNHATDDAMSVSSDDSSTDVINADSNEAMDDAEDGEADGTCTACCSPALCDMQ